VLTDFGGGGLGDAAGEVAVQPDGKIVAAGSSDATEDRDFALARYSTTGALDSNFGTGGTVLTDFGGAFGQDSGTANAMVIQPDGKMVIQPDGKILAAGSTLPT
jgi:uncharacterized delta-60 repeat protein